MLFMSISTWKPENTAELVQRRAEGPAVPDGIKVLGEWVDAAGGRVFRLSEANDVTPLMLSAYAWSDLMEMSIIPVMQTQSALDAIA